MKRIFFNLLSSLLRYDQITVECIKSLLIFPFFDVISPAEREECNYISKF